MKRERTAGAGWSLVAIATSLLAACNLLPGGGERVVRETSPEVGGTLRLAVTKPSTLDPSKADDYASWLVLRQICEPLITSDPATGQLLPGTAEKWEVSDSGKKATFFLRKDVRFHNSDEVVADDYVFSLSRFVHKETGSSRRFWLESVQGYRDVAEGKEVTLAGVSAADAHTLVVEMAQPFSEIAAVLSHPAVGSALPEEEANKKEFRLSPVCTGPYELSEPWDGEGPIRLVRSSSYYAENVGFSRGGRGFANQIVLEVVESISDGYQLFEEGEVDIAEVPINEKLVEARLEAGRVHVGPSGLVSYIGLPVTKGAFTKEELRRSLALSVDRNALIEELLAGSRAIPPGYLPRTAGPASDQASCRETFRPTATITEAQKAFEDSEVDAEEVKLNVYYNNGKSGHALWLSEIARQWEEHLKIQSELKGEEYRKYLDFLAEGEADGPFRLAWAVEYPSPEAILGPLFRSGSSDNFTGYSSEEFDEALDKARATDDQDDRRERYAEAAQVLCRDLPAIIMWFGVRHFAFAEDVASETEFRVGIFGDPVLRELGKTS